MNDLLSFFQIGFPALYILFFPGLFLSFLFFDLGEIDLLERIALSMALSLAVVPLLTFYASLTGIKITAGSVMLILFILFLFTAAALGIKWFLKKGKKGKKHEGKD